MRAESITTIHGILIKEKKDAETAKKVLREQLIEKYGTEWIDSCLTAEEKEAVSAAWERLTRITSALEDYQNHNF